MTSLAGNWILQRKGSDYVPGIESVVGVPYSTRIINDEHMLRIEQKMKPNEEISLTHIYERKSECIYFGVGKINFESAQDEGVIIGVVVQVDEDFTECSLLRMGPKKGQKSLEQMKTINGGEEIRIEIDHVLPNGDTLKLIKRLKRAPRSDNFPSFAFSNFRNINNWIQPSSHASSTLKRANCNIKDIVNMNLNGRRFNGTLSSESNVQMYKIHIDMDDKAWSVCYRYKEFDTLRKFLEQEIAGIDNFRAVPIFPPKSFGTLKGKGLEKRKEDLIIYLNYFLNSGGYNRTNVVDVLSSFLEIPEHLPTMVASVPHAQSALRRQYIVAAPSFDHQPDLVPKHIISSILTNGLRVIKFCNGRSEPHYRVLKLDAKDLKTFYYCPDWGSDHSSRLVGVPEHSKVINLRHVVEIRRGTTIDSQCPEHCGTEVLRRHCHPARFAYCISFITTERTYDFQLLNRDDFNRLVPSLQTFFKSIKQTQGTTGRARSSSITTVNTTTI